MKRVNRDTERLDWFLNRAYFYLDENNRLIILNNRITTDTAMKSEKKAGRKK